MINFSGIDKHQHVTESSHTKIVSNETERGSAEDPLSMQRTESNETAIVSGIPSITNDENVIIAPGQGKKTVSVFTDYIFCQVSLWAAPFAFICFATHKIKPGTLTELTVKNNFKGTIEKFVVRD